MIYPKLPQELQTMIINCTAGDIPTLVQSSQVNKSWNNDTFRLLYSNLTVDAVACRPRAVTWNADGLEAFHVVERAEDPTTTFEDKLNRLPTTFNNEVRSLTLCGASLQKRIKYAARGIELIKPVLDGCTVRGFLERFPNMHTLRIEDVDWADCQRTGLHCDCLASVKKRTFNMLALRRIQHICVGMNATFVLQAATSITNLVLEGLRYEESGRPPYRAVDVHAFTFALLSHPWGLVVPGLGINKLQKLDMTGMSWVDIGCVNDIIAQQQLSLEEFAVKVWWCGNGE